MFHLKGGSSAPGGREARTRADGAPRYGGERLRSVVPSRRLPGISAGKSIFDPVHGPVRLDGAALALVASPEFQRLWGVRQTGFAHLVFPGANHTRLEHSLGTFWVAGEMATRLGLDPEERQLVAVGGLLHDLGHAPFSHTLDGPLLEVTGERHERVSRRRVEGSDRDWPASKTVVPGTLERFGLSPREVADLIDPRRPSPRAPLPGSVLHGAIDADRLDYLQRDAHYTGVAHGAIDAVRLFDTLRAVGGRIVFAEKGRSAVEGFAVGRALMYSTVYYHKTVRAAEMMAQAAVERSPGYPEQARGLFRLTDGELLGTLRTAGGTSAALVEGLLERRLYKRAFGLREVPREQRARWRRWLEQPEERRALEDDLARALGGRPGSVLVDLAGMATRGDPAEDWGTVGLLERETVTYPFREPGPWHAFAHRPTSGWQATVFVAPRLRTPSSERAIARAIERR